jgi:hypothetical protein
MVSACLNGHLVSACWITHLMHAADMPCQTVKGKHIDGYVQKFEVKIIHVDSTGELINIPNYIMAYSQIMNYVMLVKDSMKIDSPSILIT